MNTWIDAKDKLPEAEREVIVLTSKGTITTVIYEDGTI